MKASFLHSGWRTPDAWLAHFCIAALLLLLGAGVALGLVHTASDVADLARQGVGPIVVHWLVPALLALASIAAALWLARRPQPISTPLFLGVLFALTLVLRSILIDTVEPTWNTDYLRYWQRAMEMAANGHVSASNIYQQRALLVPYPVELLFGPGATTALKWTNALLLLLIQLAVYDVMRLSFNHQAAQSSSIVLLASPLPAYAALIPSHDFWSLVFLAGAIWAAARTWRLPRTRLPRIASILALGIACAVFAYCLELQRSTGRLACIALVVASIVYLVGQRMHPSQSRNTPGPALLAVVVLALVLQPLVSIGARAIGIHPDSGASADASVAMKYAAHGGSMSTGRSAWYARFNDRFHEKSLASSEEAWDFSRSVILSTWSLQPLGKLDAMGEHAGRLFSLSYPPDWDTLLRQPKGMSKSVRSALIVHIGVFGLLLLAAMLASLLVLCLKPSRLAFPALSVAVFVAGVALVLLTVFENKPFNIAPAWLLYPMLLGCASARAHPRQPATQPTNRAAARLVALAAAGVVVGGLAIWFCFRSVYGVTDGMVLDRWHLQLDQSGAGAAGWEDSLAHEGPRAFEPRYYVHDRRSFVLRDAPADAGRIQARSDRLYLTLRFPPAAISAGDRLSAEREICLDGARDKLEFFMFAPYLRRDVKEAFTIEVAVDGNVMGRRPIPHDDRSDSMQLVSIPGLPAGDGRCHTLSITLRSNVDRTALSWANASHVEIWYPRLVP